MMRLFFAYLKYHIKSILLYTVFTGVFCVVFYLAEAPLDAVLYAAAICIFLAAVIAGVSFLRFRRRHLLLIESQKTIDINMNTMPAPDNIIEKDYRELISVLSDAKRRVESNAATASAEATDYYTLWAHQIKTPISAMHLLLQSDAPDPSELDEQLFKIEQYVEMVLQYIRTEGSASDFVFRKYKLDIIVRRAVRKYAKLFIKRKISLDYEPLELSAVTDDKWLSFVIEQFLLNSLKYTAEGGRISIYAEGEALVVADSGIGISEEDLPRVCDKGYTGYNGRQDRKSTGIGLYLVSQILRRLSHTMRIESEVGVGTKVYLEFPEAPPTE